MSKVVFSVVLISLYSARTFLLYLPLIIFLSGCASYKIPTEQFVEEDHWLYTVIPRHRSQIEWYDIGHWTSWMLLGNDDDGIFGPPEYRPDEQNNTSKALRWTLRNPLHNFCYYIIGNAQSQNTEFTLLNLTPHNITLFNHEAGPPKNYGAESSSLFIALHGNKPYISACLFYTPNYHGEFYIGWRERGNFGIKFVPFTKTPIVVGTPSQILAKGE